MTGIDHEIVAEVEKALRTLGASEVLMFRAVAMSPAALYEEMERLGADPYLLALSGWSWWGIPSDEDVLDHLRAWNAGAFKFERLASTGEVDKIRAELAARKRKLVTSKVLPPRSTRRRTAVDLLQLAPIPPPSKFAWSRTACAPPGLSP